MSDISYWLKELELSTAPRRTINKSKKETSFVNNVHLKYTVCPFRPTYLTLSRGSNILSAHNQNDEIVVYAHTADVRIKDDNTRSLGVSLAQNDNNWEVWEVRVYRAGMRTNLGINSKYIGTVVLRDEKCFNHVYATNMGELWTT